MVKKLLLAMIGAVIVLGAGVYTAFQLSPWPSVWLIRHSFDQGAAEAAASVAPHVPKGIKAQRGLSYAPDDKDALFDVYAPASPGGPLPAVIWVHGGGFISGSRKDLDGYLQVLASKGFVAVAIDYTIAPEAKFPTPVRQTNAAIKHIIANAARFNIDPGRIFLAGDSAGAQIAAQAALVISSPDYARQAGIAPGIAREPLKGLILYCGPYDPASMNFDGPFGGFMRTVIWSYVGTRDHRDPRVAKLSVPPHLVPTYPPVFISVGNADPLAPQSLAFAKALEANGVGVETLFFPHDHQPPLDHEYQLLLSTTAGRLAMDRSVSFLKEWARIPASPDKPPREAAAQ